MTQKTKDTPGVIAPPPLIFLGGISFSLMVQWFYPYDILPPQYLNVSRFTGVLLVTGGLGIILAARAQMRRAQTNIEPWKPTNAIIADGVYSYSRNPIYVAMILIYLGVKLIFNSVWFTPFLVLVLLAIHFGVILREERYLENKFGDDYLNYKSRVRRWI